VREREREREREGVCVQERKRERVCERDGYTENFVLFKAVNVLINQGALYRATGLHDYKLL
jgi:hypothetical protein